MFQRLRQWLWDGVHGLQEMQSESSPEMSSLTQPQESTKRLFIDVVEDEMNLE